MGNKLHHQAVGDANLGNNNEVDLEKQTNHLSSIISILILLVAAAVGGIVPLSFSNPTLNHKCSKLNSLQVLTKSNFYSDCKSDPRPILP